MNNLAKNKASINIPAFALYGETALVHKPEFVHIEDIYERSSRNGWEIKPHRHTHLYQILCMTSGHAEVRLDDVWSQHQGARVVIMPAGVVHGFRFHPETQGVVLSFAVSLFGLDAENQLGPLLEGSLSHPNIINFDNSYDSFQLLAQYLEHLRVELAVSNENQQLALFALVKLVLLTIRRRLHDCQHDNVDHDSGIQLIRLFRQLLEAHYREGWKISDYSRELNTSVSTLNRACLSVFGTTAKKKIMERLHIEAKRRLIYTQETLDKISFHLGYKDTAYFSRVFKQLEGISPKHFRQSNSAA